MGLFQGWQPRDIYVKISVKTVQFCTDSHHVYKQVDTVWIFIEACIGVPGIQNIYPFTSRDIGYFPFYFQGYGILWSIPGILLSLL